MTVLRGIFPQSIWIISERIHTLKNPASVMMLVANGQKRAKDQATLKKKNSLTSMTDQSRGRLQPGGASKVDIQRKFYLFHKVPKTFPISRCSNDQHKMSAEKLETFTWHRFKSSMKMKREAESNSGYFTNLSLHQSSVTAINRINRHSYWNLITNISQLHVQCSSLVLVLKFGAIPTDVACVKPSYVSC